MSNKSRIMFMVAISGVLMLGLSSAVSADTIDWGYNSKSLIYKTTDDITSNIKYDIVDVKVSEQESIKAYVPKGFSVNNFGNLNRDIQVQDSSVAYNTKDINMNAILWESNKIKEERQSIISDSSYVEHDGVVSGVVEFKGNSDSENITYTEKHSGKLEIPDVRSEFKSYMDYRKIQSKSTPQYRLQQLADTTTDSEGFRKYKGEYLVAVGSYYAKEIGTRMRITFENGQEIYAVLGDQKSDMHTDALHQHRNGNVVEFIVDVDKISSKCRTSGDMSNAVNANIIGKVTSIEVIGKYEIKGSNSGGSEKSKVSEAGSKTKESSKENSTNISDTFSSEEDLVTEENNVESYEETYVAEGEDGYENENENDSYVSSSVISEEEYIEDERNEAKERNEAEEKNETVENSGAVVIGFADNKEVSNRDEE